MLDEMIDTYRSGYRVNIQINGVHHRWYREESGPQGRSPVVKEKNKAGAQPCNQGENQGRSPVIKEEISIL